MTEKVKPGSSLASGDRRENRDFVPVRDRVVASDIILVDRDSHDREIPQRLGIGGAAPTQPVEQSGHIAHMLGQGGLLLGVADARTQPGEVQQLHDPNTSEKGRNSMMVRGATSLISSPITAKPSDCTIDDRMPAPSFGYRTATARPFLRFRLARRYSRRPGFLRYAKPASTGKVSGGAASAPPRRRISGRARIAKVSAAATGFPGKPANGTPRIWPSATGRPGLIANRQKSMRPSFSIADLTWSSSPVETPPEVTIRSCSAAAAASVSPKAVARSGWMPRSVTSQPRRHSSAASMMRLAS